jgi:hypothetical protein
MGRGAYFSELNELWDALPLIDGNKVGDLQTQIEDLKMTEGEMSQQEFVTRCTGIRTRVHALLAEINQRPPVTAEDRMAASQKNIPYRRTKNGRRSSGGAGFRS